MMMDTKTIEYYNTNTEAFISDTFNTDMTNLQDRFLSYLEKGDRILDLGCGSGRDTKYFISKGFDVEAIDGSEELCMKAFDILGVEIRHLYFDELDYQNEFDGIWACASLLHVNSENLPSIISRCFKALKKDGVFYLSFKLGDFEGERNDRYYTDMTEEKMRNLLSSIPESNRIEEILITGDARKDRPEKWLNVFVRKI